jgi:pimeloyl-ACP methyl ester carboxylesterase
MRFWMVCVKVLERCPPLLMHNIPYAFSVLTILFALYRLTNSRMVTFGRSLGGAVAISLAHRFPDLVSGVVVENTFLSVGAMVDVLMPFLKHVRRLVLYMNWDSDVKVADLKMPILFISGTLLKRSLRFCSYLLLLLSSRPRSSINRLYLMLRRR